MVNVSLRGRYRNPCICMEQWRYGYFVIAVGFLKEPVYGRDRITYIAPEIREIERKMVNAEWLFKSRFYSRLYTYIQYNLRIERRR